MWKATSESAEKNGLQVAGIELRERPYDYARALLQAPTTHRSFLLVMTSPYFAIDRKRLVDFTMQQRIGSMFVFREYVDLGGLMSYGPNRIVLSQRMADYVNRLARGAKRAHCFRNSHQPQDRKVAGPSVFAGNAATRQRGDRIMLGDVRYWHIADIPSCTAHVRFRG